MVGMNHPSNWKELDITERHIETSQGVSTDLGFICRLGQGIAPSASYIDLTLYKTCEDIFN